MILRSEVKYKIFVYTWFFFTLFVMNNPQQFKTMYTVMFMSSIDYLSRMKGYFTLTALCLLSLNIYPDIFVAGAIATSLNKIKVK